MEVFHAHVSSTQWFLPLTSNSEYIGDLGPIYHMDYSENITQSFKYEPQELHFNKKQYSLHCTVKHEEVKNKNFHHFSDELTHTVLLNI